MSSHSQLPSLRDQIINHLTVAEIRDACTTLGIDYNRLRGETTLEKVQSLIEYCLREEWLEALVRYCKDLYPEVSWVEAGRISQDLKTIQTGIVNQEPLHDVLPEGDVAPVLAALRYKRQELLFRLAGDGAIAYGDSAVAVGAGGVYVGGNVGGGITINVGGEEPKSPEEVAQNRVLDAAIARRVPVGRSTRLVAMVRREESGGLLAILTQPDDEAQKDGIQSELFPLHFPKKPDGTLGPADVVLRYQSPDFEPNEQSEKLSVPVEGDSRKCVFLLVPKRTGELNLTLSVLRHDSRLVAQHVLTTSGNGKESTDKVVVSMPMVVLGMLPDGQTETSAAQLQALIKRLSQLQELYESGLLGSQTFGQITVVASQALSRTFRSTLSSAMQSAELDALTQVTRSQLDDAPKEVVSERAEAVLKQLNLLKQIHESDVMTGSDELGVGQTISNTQQELTQLSVPALLRYMGEDSPPDKRRQAAKALVALGAGESLDYLLAQLLSDDVHTRLFAIQALGQKIGTMQIVPYLLRALETYGDYRIHGAVLEALNAIRVPRYWTEPYGEPEWVEIPAGEFTMGGVSVWRNAHPVHTVYLPTYDIARAPITNAQYLLFVKETGHSSPDHWQDGRIPKGLESHPVVYVSWADALAYCQWLSKVTGKQITLPSEAEWEKATRGDRDAREYPWGDEFDRLRCNTGELGLGTTTPVGIFPDGASPYGVLDMSGNVWEWTRSKPESYPYRADDGREDMEDTRARRVLRGGSFANPRSYARAASRLGINLVNRNLGFRVVVVRRSPFSS